MALFWQARLLPRICSLLPITWAPDPTISGTDISSDAHSTLGAAVQQAADEASVALTPAPFPEQNIFVRSDHYRFVQQGVPSVFLVTGTKSMDGQTDTQAIFEAFLKDHYHMPSDDTAQPIDYAAAARFTRINFGIGEIVANELERPRWHEGDFFGETFGH